MPRTPGFSKRVSDVFVSPDPANASKFICRCGTRRKKSGSSYQNLLTRVQSAHPGLLRIISIDDDMCQAQLDSYFSTARSKHLFVWIDLIVNNLLPFYFVTKKEIRKQVKYEPTSLKTSMKYIGKLTETKKEKISSLLPDKLALVFDGWTSCSTHYLAVFASFSSTNNYGHETRLLSVSTMGDECNLRSAEHYEFLTYILNLYKKSWSNVVALIGDNVNTNKSLANRTGIPLVGCASHRLNLAMRDVLDEEEQLIERINSIMVKMRGLLLSAKLQKLNPLKPIVRNVTRWSSTHHMLKRYIDLREYLTGLESDEIELLRQSPSENRRLESFMVYISPLESVTKELQCMSTTINDARALFDAMIEKYPNTNNSLSTCAPIVHSRNFEKAIANIQRENANVLTRDEKKTVTNLLLQVAEPSNLDVSDGLSFAKRALKR